MKKRCWAGSETRLGDLEGAEHPSPQLHGVVDRLHPRGDQGVLVVAEVGLAGPGRDDQAVVGVVVAFARDRLRVHHPRLQVESRHLGQDDLHVLATAQHVAQHGRDLTGRHDAGRHLVEERLEQVVVPPVDQRDLDVGAESSRAAGRPPKPPPTTTTRWRGVALTMVPFLAAGEPQRSLGQDTRSVKVSACYGAGGSLTALTPSQTRGRQAQASRSVRCSPTRMALAMAVSAGLTAPMLGKKLVSTT